MKSPETGGQYQRSDWVVNPPESGAARGGSAFVKAHSPIQYGRDTSGTGDTTASPVFASTARLLHKGKLDSGLLASSLSLVETLEEGEPLQYTLQCEALRGRIADLWETAAHASHAHQSILAVVEGAVLVDLVIPPQFLRPLREALRDLSSEMLSDSNIDVIRETFVRAGYNPIAPIGDFEDVE